jgi:hypothetical protein
MPYKIRQGSNLAKLHNFLFIYFNKGGIKMMKTALKITLTVMIAGLLVSAAYAGPISLNETQMDSITAGRVEKVPAFLCTVNVHGDGLLNAKDHRSDSAALHVGIGTPSGYDVDGNYVEYVTVAPHGAGDLYVPAQATNTGTPGGGFSVPGQSGSSYTAIWNGNN